RRQPCSPSRSPAPLPLHGAATTAIYTLSLHDALPILGHVDEGDAGLLLQGTQLEPHVLAQPGIQVGQRLVQQQHGRFGDKPGCPDRKSTRLNSSHVSISYAVFCLKKKNRTKTVSTITT